MEKINFVNNSMPYLSAENLNQLQSNIENSFKNEKTESTTDTYSCDYINKLNTYSTEEQIIGTWIDGKPIYRKVITGTSGTGGSWQLIPTNISNLNKMININFMVGMEDENYPSSFYVSSTYQIVVRYNKGKNSIGLMTGSGYSNLPYHFILEYTKTTD